MSLNVVHTIYVTKDCFLKCAYCYERITRESNLSTSATIKILDRIYKLDNSPKMVEIFGGEPLLNWGSFLTILNYSHTPNTKLTTITNGVMLTPQKIDVLKNSSILVGISYDGRSAHDIYRKSANNKGTERIVRKRIMEAVRENLNIAVCMTFHQANANSIVDDIEELHSWGVNKFQIYTVHNNRFRVPKVIRYKMYERIIKFAEDRSIGVNLSMDYSESNCDHYYYYDDQMKIQKRGTLGHWEVVGWE